MRVFYTDNGKMYAATTPKNANHAEMNFPTKDIIVALSCELREEGEAKSKDCAGNEFTREEMIRKINHVHFPRTMAVLAVEQERANDEAVAE